MIYRISTTGITGLVVLRDLGDRLLVHPTVDIDLGLEYSECELVESHDLQAAIDNGKILVIEKSDYALTLPDVITVASGVAESEIADHAYSKTDLNAGQLDTRYYTETEINTISGTFNKEITEIEESLTLTSGSIIKNHGGLSGLSNDDHPQYHTDARGDIRYYDKITVYNMITSASGSIIKAHSGLTGLSNDDHPQYHTDARGDAKYYSKTAVDNLITSTSGSIIKDHGGLTGLSDDDHPQYHTDARGDAKYYSKTSVDNLITSTSGSIIKAHSGLTGLSNDEHTQYILANGTRSFTSVVSGVIPVTSANLATKGYVDSGLTTVSGSIIKAHSGLTGLSNDEHTQYILANGTRSFTSAVSGVIPVTSANLATKGYVDSGLTTVSGSIIKAHSGLTGLSNDDHPQYHTDARGDAKYYSKTSVDNLITSTSGSIIKDHGGLTGLSDDDHPQYHTDARGDVKYYSKTAVDNLITSTSGSIIKAHSGLTGLSNDEHTQYILANGTRSFTSVVSGVIPVTSANLATKGYVDSGLTTVSGSIIKAHSGLTGLSNDEHTQYILANGTRSFTSVVSGVIPVTSANLATKGYVDSGLTTVSGSIIKDHGILTGLSDDDHSQYHTDARGDIRYYSKTVVDNLITSTSGSIIKDHGGLTGLGNDDHTHYILSNGTRAFTSTVLGVTPTQPEHLATKGYVDSLPSGQSSIFGSEYRFMVSEGESNTNSTSPIIKLTLTANNLVGGTYRIGWYYEWRRSGNSNSYVADVIVDGCTVIMNHYAAPKLTTDYLPSSGFGIVNLDSDNHTIYLRYYASNSNYTSYIKKARIEIWRVQ